MSKVLKLLFGAAFLLFAVAAPATAGWVEKAGWIDYAQHKVFQDPDYVEWPFDGMPDFNQKQDAWQNSANQWTWCCPVATANCLWWFDSKFETIKMKSLPGNPVRPPAISDHYSLVHALGAWDDHDPGNTPLFIQALAAASPVGVPFNGMTARQCSTMIESYLSSAAVNLWGHYSVTIVERPDFEYIRDQVIISQDVILLLGFWQQNDTGGWYRIGGHWVTVTGVDTNDVANPWISFSDPCIDNAEMGWPGTIWDGWITGHVPIPHGSALIHNDAGNVSHDWYPVGSDSPSPGGNLSANQYGYEFDYDDWINFQGQNTPERLQDYGGDYDPSRAVHVEIEDLVVVCPKFDYGDLEMDYPTIDIMSCGPAHPLTEKAWLGEQIDDEIQPRIYNNDNFDDGVAFQNLPWMPCTNVQVSVTVTTGPNYAGEDLYLNAWKDGNIDGDFDDGPDANEDDWLCCSEWVIQDYQVAGAGTYDIPLCDPGIFDIGRYDLKMRFRLTSQAVGRYGYGGYWGGGVSNGLGTYDIDWVLGEVEDYVKADSQLAVELIDFDAFPGDGSVTLAWKTASETDNSRFDIARDGTTIASVEGAGNSATQCEYTWVDEDVVNGTCYHYTLTSVDINGVQETIASAEATPGPQHALITDYALHQNYPNPFNASTLITFDLAEASEVSLKVYNLIGQEIKELARGTLDAGRHVVSFNAADLPSGVYLYRLEAGDFTAQKKMILMK